MIKSIFCQLFTAWNDEVIFFEFKLTRIQRTVFKGIPLCEIKHLSLMFMLFILQQVNVNKFLKAQQILVLSG